MRLDEIIFTLLIDSLLVFNGCTKNANNYQEDTLDPTVSGKPVRKVKFPKNGLCKMHSKFICCLTK